jgi:hypothetical protein
MRGIIALIVNVIKSVLTLQVGTEGILSFLFKLNRVELCLSNFILFMCLANFVPWLHILSLPRSSPISPRTMDAYYRLLM